MASASIILAVIAEPGVALKAEQRAAAAAAAALTSDDECREGTFEQCSLNALQLQRRQASVHVSPQQINGTDAPSQAIASVGGARTLSNKSSQGMPGSCVQYGCGGDDPSQHCQCNDQCTSNGTCCSDFQAECFVSSDAALSSGFYRGKIVTGYHQTSYRAGRSILRHGFRPGHVGYCGGGIYFASSPMATYGKAIGPDSHWGFIIKAKIALGRSKFISRPSCMSPRLGVASLSRRSAAHYLARYHADSFSFNPLDGLEYVVADPRRVVSMHQYRR